MKTKNIQSHKVLARRLKSMAAAALRQDNEAAYKQLTELAEEHERKAKVFRKKTFIFER